MTDRWGKCPKCGGTGLYEIKDSAGEKASEWCFICGDSGYSGNAIDWLEQDTKEERQELTDSYNKSWGY